MQQLLVDVFLFNDTATTEIYTLSLHDALPISRARLAAAERHGQRTGLQRAEHHRQRHRHPVRRHRRGWIADRSEEHTSELQSRQYLVCSLLLETKIIPNSTRNHYTARVTQAPA